MLIKKIIYKIYEKMLENDVRRGIIPKHIAIIMDGNRRFADKYGYPRYLGHRYGAEKLVEVIQWCFELGIRIVTVYALSLENFYRRSKEELENLFKIFYEYSTRFMNDERIHKNKIRIKFIGRIDLLPPYIVKNFKRLEEITKNYKNYILNVAVCYSGREEILEAIRKICMDFKSNKISLDEIDEELFRKYLYMSDIPDPDMIIRTSGEERLSNFLLWQAAYSELYFCEAYWPEFRKIDLLRAIRTYQKRERRFGK